MEESKSPEIVITTIRIEASIYQWIREYIYHESQGKNLRGMSMNQVMNTLMSEAIEARTAQVTQN